MVNRTPKHSLVNSPEYYAWNRMRQRCNNSNHERYKDYGGRGITICERWGEFINFYTDMGSRPSDLHSLDRINNDGNYEPSNCRWATDSQQNRNRRIFGNQHTNKTHCKNGHEFTEENTYISSIGGRVCRICKINYMKIYNKVKI